MHALVAMVAMEIVQGVIAVKFVLDVKVIIVEVVEVLIIVVFVQIVKNAIVNKGHKNGNEIHMVYNNGVVKVYNERTRRFITVLIARVPQIERYKVKVTKTMRNKIKSHVAKGYNHIEF